MVFGSVGWFGVPTSYESHDLIPSLRYDNHAFLSAIYSELGKVRIDLIPCERGGLLPPA